MLIHTRAARLTTCLLTVVLTVPLSAARPAAATQKEDLGNYITQGKLALGRKQWDIALRQLQAALKIDPQNGNVHYYIAKAYGGLRNADLERSHLDLARRYGSSDLAKNAAPLSPAPSLQPPVSPSGGFVRRAPLPATVREKWALVVGISSFQNSSLNLNFPAKDAEDLARTLTDPRYGRFKPDNVIKLTDSKATKTNILDGFDRIVKQSQPDDLVVIFLSSHGVPSLADSARQEGYFVTHDTDVDRLFSTAIGMSHFTAYIKERIQAKRKVVLLDTCYSGQAQSGSKGMEMGGALQSQTAAELCAYGTVVITSSSPNEESYESERIRNGYFTYFLIEALKKGDGRSTISAVYRHLKGAVPKAVKQEKNRSQYPQIFYGTSDEVREAGEIRIGVATED